MNPQNPSGWVHHHLLSYIIEYGKAPTLPSLAALCGLNEQNTWDQLKALDVQKGLLFNPGSDRCWVVPPFALWPTNFWVKSKAMSWWGNCVWCSLGIAAIIKTDVDIVTRIGAEDETCIIKVRSGKIEPDDLVVHLSIPIARAWENVIYFCGTVLAFHNNEGVNQWCHRHSIEKGVILPINQVWELAKHWYGSYLDTDWSKWSREEARVIFEEVGLTGDFWKV